MNKIKNLLTISPEELTAFEEEKGNVQLRRTGRIVDVLFALTIFNIFKFLPVPEIDGFGKEDLIQVLKDSYVNYMVMAIGIVLILLYWEINNMQFNNLKRTNPTHAILTILQVFFLMIYLYFVRLDTEFESPTITLQMQSIVLAIAGGLSVFSWIYAWKKDLLSENVTQTEYRKVFLKTIPEPIVSLLTLPLAGFGVGIWTAGWLLLIPVTYLCKKIKLG